MKTVQTRTTYLQTLRLPAERVVAPDGVRVETDVHLSAEEYCSIYRAVGDSFHWVDRLRLSREDLLAEIHHSGVSIHQLRVDEEPAGFCELDRREESDIEVVYFGLISRFFGRGLGKFFLNWTLHKAWSYSPRRVWLHTCDLDHEAALPNYLKAGFEVFDVRIIEQPIDDAAS